MSSTHYAATGPAVWLGEAYAGSREWIYHFSADAIADIDQAIRGVRHKGLQLDDITAADFDLPSLAADLDRMNAILGEGRGFVLLKGLDPTKYSDREFEIILWGIGTHIGIGVSQSHLGDRIGQVKDVGGKGRYYTAGGPIEVHMDPVDVTGLLCLRQAKQGGESWIMSSLALHNILLDERPDLLDCLYEGFHYGGPQGGPNIGKTPHRLPVYAQTGDETVAFYLPAAIVGRGSGTATDLSPTQREALAYLDQAAVRPGVYMRMDLQPGDIQFLNNRKLFHARTDYLDHEDPRRGRHLLRLWLMMPDWSALPTSMRFIDKTDRAGGGIPKGSAQVPQVAG